MKLTVDVPDPLADDLVAQCRDAQLDVSSYAVELLAQAVQNRKLGDDARLANRPDWQAALDRGRADIAAGRTVDHAEVVDWHRRHPAE